MDTIGVIPAILEKGNNFSVKQTPSKKGYTIKGKQTLPMDVNLFFLVQTAFFSEGR